jgi:4'-phosphopantetheinyl transferase
MALDLADSTFISCFSLDLPRERIAELAGVLSSEELDRANRFVFPGGRSRYIAGRGRLRSMLGAVLDREPASLRFEYGPQGKPSLVSDGSRRDLRFNFSHSHGIGLFAVQDGDELGIDLELVRPAPDALATARRFFSLEECRLLEALPAADLVPGFFRCWTRKEAVLKSFGRGLSHPLDGFTVSCAATTDPQSVVLREGDTTLTRWLLPLPSPAPSCVAALATAGRLRPIRWAAEGLA